MPVNQGFFEIINHFYYKTVKYSYNELEEMMGLLNKYKQSTRDSEIAKSWHGHFLDQSDNAICVQLEDVNDEQIALFRKEVTDSPMITFMNGGPFVNLGKQDASLVNTNSEKDNNSTIDYSSSRADGERTDGKIALLQPLLLAFGGILFVFLSVLAVKKRRKSRQMGRI